jgi:hypothetical protein
MKVYRKQTASVIAALAFGGASSAQAIIFATPGEVIGDVQAFDWSVSNALAVGGANIDAGDTFQLLSHGALGNYTNSASNPILGTGLNSSYEITYATSFEEEVTASTGGFPGVQGFTTTGNTLTAANYFEIWFDTSLNSNMLAGTGFNDGTLIASGTILAGGLGAFSADDPFEALDQFGADDYAGIATVTGSGGTGFEVVVDFGFYDTDFFVNGLGPLGIDFDTAQNLPFTQTDPSALFVDTAGGAAPTQDGATLASIGAINGVDGPNVLLQVDASSSLDLNQVPAPGSLALIGLGLFGLAMRKRKAAV